ncbi:MAG: DUF3108 domain-containing protein [Calditrichaeota bacterium]|nr:MAG: DUF3108 domain-containing protein [Calditrichota bacterium]MBL1207819.1 DUF3108 domain-containing protein [Calditrichota bacterium]NOG47653.1 DUF3108 domain-containing protein [Calditrichota bacterium]
MFIRKFTTKLFQLIITILLLIFTQSIQAQDHKEFKWQKGQELTYGVDYSFFHLGKITLSNLGKEEVNGKNANHIKVVIQSNPLLFWIDHESVYNTYITDDFKVARFVSDEKIDGEKYNAIYDFDYDNMKINVSLVDLEDPKKVQKKTLTLTPKKIDGISLIYFARINSAIPGKDTVSTFIEDKSGDVVFNFTEERTITEIDSIPQGLSTLYFNGELFVEGIAGVTGPFEAWFSDDAFRVPILSYMEVFIGSVKIELEGWKKWSPYNEVSEKNDSLKSIKQN